MLSMSSKGFFEVVPTSNGLLEPCCGLTPEALALALPCCLDTGTDTSTGTMGLMVAEGWMGEAAGGSDLASAASITGGRCLNSVLVAE